MSTALTVFSIGYQGRSLDDFCEAVRAAGVAQVVDVREVPWSQRPQFRKGRLAEALKAVGVRYVHCAIAGNPYRPQTGVRRTFAQCASLYRRHLQRRGEILETLRELVSGGTSALLCYEAARDECHRGVLLTALQAVVPVHVIDL